MHNYQEKYPSFQIHERQSFFLLFPRQIQMENRQIFDILQELRSQIMNSVCIIKVKPTSLWKSSICCFLKSTFSPCSTLHVSITDDNETESQQADMSLSQYFKNVLNDIENSDVFEGSERKNLSLNPDGKLLSATY